VDAVFLFIPLRWVAKSATFAGYFLPLRSDGVFFCSGIWGSRDDHGAREPPCEPTSRHVTRRSREYRPSPRKRLPRALFRARPFQCAAQCAARYSTTYTCSAQSDHRRAEVSPSWLHHAWVVPPLRGPDHPPRWQDVVDAGDAGDYATRLPKAAQVSGEWQTVIGCLIAAAEGLGSGCSVEGTRINTGLPEVIFKP